MKVLDAGHTYLLEGEQQIWFIKKEKGELIQHGTTNEEMIEVLIDRLKYLDGKFPCPENKVAINNLECALVILNGRTAKRVAQGVEGQDLPHVS
jgi:hypothetical protein